MFVTLLRKFFSFKGRLRRRDYWLCTLALAVATMAVVLPLVFGLGLQIGDPRVAALSLIGIWPSVAILVKRIHDRDKTGWMAANYWGPWLVATGLSFVPQFGLGGVKVILDIVTTVVGVWYVIEFGFMDGAQGKNAYGPSPKGVMAIEKLEDVFA
jgi:uncharacterized membrane protein YhaH (DUF805 family)